MEDDLGEPTVAHGSVSPLRGVPAAKTEPACSELPSDLEAPGQPQEITSDDMARYLATRGFVWSAWVGAILLTISYTQLYWAVLSGAYSGKYSLLLGVVVAIGGGIIFRRSRALWSAIDPSVGRKAMTAALLVAGAGGVFWLLFLLFSLLTLAGVELLPE